MPVVQKPFTFVSKTPARATEMNANFDALFNLVNGALDAANLRPVTFDDTKEPTQNQADLYLAISWLANRLKVLTGEVSWSVAPSISFKGHRQASVLDHPDGSVTDPKIGTRTIDPTKTPAGNGPGDLTTWLSWLANRLKALSGAANWYEDPIITLAGAKAGLDAANQALQAHAAKSILGESVHGVQATTAGGTEAGRLALTDSLGRVGAAKTAYRVRALTADPANPEVGEVWLRTDL